MKKPCKKSSLADFDPCWSGPEAAEASNSPHNGTWVSGSFTGVSTFFHQKKMKCVNRCVIPGPDVNIYLFILFENQIEISLTGPQMLYNSIFVCLLPSDNIKYILNCSAVCKSILYMLLFLQMHSFFNQYTSQVL